MQNKKIWKKVFICSAVLAALLLVSFLAETFIFHFRYFALPQEERSLHSIPISQLDMNDLSLNENEEFFITGNDPYFSVKNPSFITYLRITPSEQSPPLHIEIEGLNKSYEVNFGYKRESVLYVNHSAENMRFHIRIDNGENTFSFQNIAVDNTLHFNFLRIFLMFSIGALLAYFILFRKIAFAKLHVTFLVIVLLFGVNMALFTPTYYAYDEKEHFVRAYQLANFDLGLTDAKPIQWVAESDQFINVYIYDKAGSLSSAVFRTYPERQNYIKEFSDSEYPHKAVYPSTAETYPFIPYTVAGLGILLSRALGMPFIYTFYAGRIFTLLGYALVCFFAIKQAKVAKRLIFFIALLPVSVFLASAYSADPMTLAFSLLAVTLFLNMLCSKDQTLNYKHPLLFSLCVAMAVMCKVPYAPLCLLILCVPKRKFKPGIHPVLVKGSVFAVVGLVAVATFAFGAMKGIQQWPIPGVSTKGQILFILQHLTMYTKIMAEHVTAGMTSYFSGAITQLAYYGTLDSIWLFVCLFGLVSIALLEDDSERLMLKAKEKLFLGAAIVCSWALVLTALYISFTPVGKPMIDGVQGRYFAPLLFPLFLLFKSSRVKYAVSAERFNVAVCGVSSLLLAVAAIVLFTAYCL